MADLLECLIQIKGLAETPARLASRAHAAAERGDLEQALRVAGCMCSSDRWLAECLRLTIGNGERSAPAQEPRDDGRPGHGSHASLQARLGDFERHRRGVVQLLEGCTADDLGRTGVLPSGRTVTVADLVALTLARDTDQLARLVR